MTYSEAKCITVVTSLPSVFVLAFLWPLLCLGDAAPQSQWSDVIAWLCFPPLLLGMPFIAGVGGLLFSF